MAQKRMFDKSITESDNFLNMALSTQALYFHLGMQADDEGFVSPTRVSRMIGSNQDEITLLIAKGLVIPFESGVVVITDWNRNNWLKTDRIRQTIYKKERKLLEISDGGYKMTDLTKIAKNVWLPSIVESRVEESNNDCASVMHDTPKRLTLMTNDQFDLFWQSYPNKKAKKPARTKFLRLSASLFDKIICAVEKQKLTRQWNDVKFVPMAQTWINQERWDDEETCGDVIDQELEDAKTMGLWKFSEKYTKILGSVEKANELIFVKYRKYFKDEI